MWPFQSKTRGNAGLYQGEPPLNVAFALAEVRVDHGWTTRFEVPRVLEQQAPRFCWARSRASWSLRTSTPLSLWSGSVETRLRGFATES